MVLTRTVDARWLALAVVLATLAGCIDRHAPERLPRPTPIALHVWLDGPEATGVAPPEGFVARLEGALRDKNLLPTRAPSGAPALWGGHLSTERRMDALLGSLPDVEHGLLVEVRVTLFSQIAGRYRWDVDVRVTLTTRAPPGGSPRSRTESLGVAAFLQYAHEGSREALDFVARQVVAAVTGLVDRHFEGSSVP